MALSREQTKVLFVASLCAVSVIFIVPYFSKTPVLLRHHGLKENGGKQETIITLHNMSTAPPESTISTSESLETHDISENNVFPTTRTSHNMFTTTPESTISTSESLETHDISENNASSTTRPAPAESKQGYILVIRYSDQITAATTNLQSLMCLAKKIGGVQVVEPFVTKGSMLGLNVSANLTKEVRMSDLFDYKVWKHANPFKKYGELASFKDLMQNGPRKLVMVQYCFRASFCYPCKHKDIILKSRVFCKLNNFELVGHECFSYEKEKMISFSSIKSLLYSKYSKSEVVVMFDVFGGIHSSNYNPYETYRFFANVPECSLGNAGNFSALRPSQSVSSDAGKFIQKYLNGLPYIAVMIRLEMVFHRHRTKISRNNRPLIAKACFTNILQRLEKIKKELGLSHVFVTLDVGRYGCEIFRGKNDNITRAIEHYTEDFLSTIYRKNMTIGEYEERHISTSRKNNPAYISVVQKEIAARGDALVLVGRTSKYQSTTNDLYNALHKNKPKYVFKLYTDQCT